MATLTAPLDQHPTASAAVRTGIALAVTVALFYALCTVAWLAAPQQFLGFMNSLFHGVDFSPLVGDEPFAWAGFAQALVVMAIWAFLAGTCFAWLRRLLGD